MERRQERPGCNNTLLAFLQLPWAGFRLDLLWLSEGSAPSQHTATVQSTTPVFIYTESYLTFHTQKPSSISRRGDRNSAESITYSPFQSCSEHVLTLVTFLQDSEENKGHMQYRRRSGFLLVVNINTPETLRVILYMHDVHSCISNVFKRSNTFEQVCSWEAKQDKASMSELISKLLKFTI